MRKNRAHRVCESACGLAACLRFRAVGKVTGEVILTVLFAAAARLSSIHETCGRLAKAPCEETFTAALYPQLVDVDQIKRGDGPNGTVTSDPDRIVHMRVMADVK